MNNEQIIRAVALIATELHIQNELVASDKPLECITGTAITQLLKCFEGYIADNAPIPMQQHLAQYQSRTLRRKN